MNSSRHDSLMRDPLKHTWKEIDNTLMQAAWELKQRFTCCDDWARSMELQQELRMAIEDLAIHRECSIHEIHVQRVKES